MLQHLAAAHLPPPHQNLKSRVPLHQLVEGFGFKGDRQGAVAAVGSVGDMSVEGVGETIQVGDLFRRRLPSPWKRHVAISGHAGLSLNRDATNGTTKCATIRRRKRRIRWN